LVTCKSSAVLVELCPRSN